MFFCFFLLQEVLEDILDLDLSVSETDDFIQLVHAKRQYLDPFHQLTDSVATILESEQIGLGPGRAHLIGIYINGYTENRELQLRESAKTPCFPNDGGRAILHCSV